MKHCVENVIYQNQEIGIYKYFHRSQHSVRSAHDNELFFISFINKKKF
jgi:hypothetical protein